MLSKFGFFLFTITLYIPFAVWSQTTDSVSARQEINPVDINAYFSKQPILELTSAAQTISSGLIEAQQTTTLLPALNTVAGVRMEERSPGSYRLAMRGSLIRSAFGIRNAKIYVDDFPLTDAGGNTYLNLLDPAAIDAIHIIKGPDGSLYGANSGGVINIAPNGFDVRKNRSSVLLSGGSFGLFQEQLSIQRNVTDNYSFSFDQSFTRSDGYRDNTALNKKTFQTAHRWKYMPRNEIRFFALYSDLGYRTPGGLTQAQMNENPRMSRPAAGRNPGAKEQQAGIYNKTFYGGIAHHAQVSDKLSHVISIFGSNTDFENPFITNYEYRKENNLGLRTYLSYRNIDKSQFQWQMQLGFEGQKGWNKIDNYNNEGGISTSPQAKDNLDNVQSSFFYRVMAKLHQRWTIEGSLGLNQSKITYRQHYPEITNPSGAIDFGSIWMPRIATSYLVMDRLAFRGSISKGYSPPTIGEVRSSDNIINTELDPEKGTSYEIGARLETKSRRFIADLSFYNYYMQNGIVRQLRENGAEYFINAGEMKQKGIEAAVWAYILAPQTERFIQALNLHSSVSYSHYRFGKYSVDDNDFSRNKVTAVPDWVWTNTLVVAFPKQFGLNISHNFTSAMPLNDANSVFSEKFHLIQAKGTWNSRLKNKRQLQFFAGVDNLLNESYSLGNDINAFGDRFFNPAPTRNYYAGVKVTL
ncbi:TonB-dependent receptor [Sphingobacterium haloxyli]|uniref:TonB-dependent receptor n=1 Tax=Sphingobacterium haloxyli TaxID=2100533 RepID=A0A2S9J6E2_9SPHI|nr:TonB-dependent receptor [Sphingobacterium haloxyli]PRD48330.1 TonB-dependent receptor [Sphingobacterium haloxyli]